MQHIQILFPAIIQIIAATSPNPNFPCQEFQRRLQACTTPEQILNEIDEFAGFDQAKDIFQTIFKNL